MTKVENLSEMFQICEKKKMSSDSLLLSDILGFPQATVWSRYKRGNADAVKIMYKIVMGREELIKKIKKEIESEKKSKE